MDEGHSIEPFGMAPPETGETHPRSAGLPAGGDRTSSRQPPPPVKVGIVRPNGSTREVTAAGFFREEYLCALLDEELCQLPDEEKLIVHLFHPDEALVQSLRDRWREGLSDNRRVRIREVLGPNDNPQELAVQLQRIEQRLLQGEKIHLAIRSPRVARMASGSIRRILLMSQHGDLGGLKVSVYGSEEIQRAIMEHMEGMVRAQDFDRLLEAGVVPGVSAKLPKSSRTRGRRKTRKSHLTPQEAVKAWIRRVEKDRKPPSSE